MKVNGVSYKMKNRRVFVGEDEQGHILMIFKQLRNAGEMKHIKDNPPFNYIVKPKLSKKCIYITKVRLTKTAFACIGNYYEKHFLPNNLL